MPRFLGFSRWELGPDLGQFLAQLGDPLVLLGYFGLQQPDLLAQILVLVLQIGQGEPIPTAWLVLRLYGALRAGIGSSVDVWSRGRPPAVQSVVPDR